MIENEKRLKQIKIENYIWIIYLVIIGLSLYANSFEKDFFKTGNINSKNNYRNINILIFSIAVIIYIYFFLDNLDDVKNLSIYDSNKKKTYNNLSLLGSIFVLISGIIFLYIAIKDVDLDVEIAFN